MRCATPGSFHYPKRGGLRYFASGQLGDVRAEPYSPKMSVYRQTLAEAVASWEREQGRVKGTPELDAKESAGALPSFGLGLVQRLGLTLAEVDASWQTLVQEASEPNM